MISALQSIRFGIAQRSNQSNNSGGTEGCSASNFERLLVEAQKKQRRNIPNTMPSTPLYEQGTNFAQYNLRGHLHWTPGWHKLLLLSNAPEGEKLKYKFEPDYPSRYLEKNAFKDGWQAVTGSRNALDALIKLFKKGNN
ncbi:MAG: hypothetical protein VKJ06_05035 [Vampirovibrionales bacterium]|nr:hypothetical protein [Vampirovibrionales bacterium]